MLEILVVVTDGVERRRIVRVLETAGYNVSGASSFDEARQVLTWMSPDLVMADERLGAYNGLQVLLRARSENPWVAAVVLTRLPDRALDVEAKRLDVQCVVKPIDAGNWPAVVSRTLHASRAVGIVDYPGGTSSPQPFLALPKAEAITCASTSAVP
jgi:DNA-binding NtrC family response regulator